MSESSDSLAKAALEYRDKSLELGHKQAARIATLEAEQSLHDAELDASTVRAEQAEAERDAAWELVEELDPHHLKRNQMGMRQQREGDE